MLHYFIEIIPILFCTNPERRCEYVHIFERPFIGQTARGGHFSLVLNMTFFYIHGM